MAPIGVLMPTYTQWGPILQNDTTYCQSRNYENRVEIVASYLDVQRSVYAQLPALVSGGAIPADGVGLFFYWRFVEVVHVLRDVARDADRRRNSLASA